DSEWVRLEIEFGAKDRVIPHEILIKCDQYFIWDCLVASPFSSVCSAARRASALPLGSAGGCVLGS
ncbi:hypothetical protein ACQCQE_20280, partial [Ralstonia pseudosolanacearum]|uniref:hypothetical protein n=1 Tax=Ralstonia pseudosolanacearum TaxID=1310165 RepID=UPI003CFA38CE